VAVSSAAKSKASASEAAEVVWQTVREESVESLVLSSSLDEVHVFLQGFPNMIRKWDGSLSKKNTFPLGQNRELGSKIIEKTLAGSFRKVT
jgi:outer membrane PBP1 activator LpoA protein